MSGMISFKHRGDFSKTLRFFNHLLRKDYLNVLDEYGRIGCDLLRQNTPVDTHETANSWDYEIRKDKNTITLTFLNTKIVKGENIAILLQYGHGTRNGGYVVGRDYINPALKPVFDSLADRVWKEVLYD